MCEGCTVIKFTTVLYDEGVGTKRNGLALRRMHPVAGMIQIF